MREKGFSDTEKQLGGRVANRMQVWCLPNRNRMNEPMGQRLIDAGFQEKGISSRDSVYYVRPSKWTEETSLTIPENGVEKIIRDPEGHVRFRVICIQLVAPTTGTPGSYHYFIELPTVRQRLANRFRILRREVASDIKKAVPRSKY